MFQTISSNKEKQKRNLLTKIRSLLIKWKVKLGYYLIGKDRSIQIKGMENLIPQYNYIPGVKCPRCGAHIFVDIFELLKGSSFFCPNPLCNLKIDIDKEKSKESLEVISKNLGSLLEIDKKKELKTEYPNINVKWKEKNN